MGLLQRWFNYPPKPNTPFITDKHGEKFWIEWDGDEDQQQMVVIYRGRFVGKVNLVFEKPNEAIIADIIIFCHQKGNNSLRKRGLGKAMLQEAIAKAREHKVIILWGWISPDKCTTVDYLVEWYQRQGFEVAGKDGRFSIRMKLG